MANPAIFPSYLANGLYKRLTLIQTAEVWGVIGLTLVAMLVNTAIATIIGARLTKELKVCNQQKYVVGCAFVLHLECQLGPLRIGSNPNYNEVTRDSGQRDQCW